MNNISTYMQHLSSSWCYRCYPHHCYWFSSSPSSQQPVPPAATLLLAPGQVMGNHGRSHYKILPKKCMCSYEGQFQPPGVHHLFSKQVLLSWNWLTYAAQAYQSGINLHHFIKGPAFHLLVQVFTWSTWMHHDRSWRLQPWIGFDLMDVRHSACSHPVWKSFNCTCMSAFYMCSNLLGYWKFESRDGLVPIAWSKVVCFSKCSEGFELLTEFVSRLWLEGAISPQWACVKHEDEIYIYIIYIYTYIYIYYIYIYMFIHMFIFIDNNLPWSKCGGLMTHDFLVFHKMCIYAGLRSIDVRGLNSTLRLSFPTGGRKAKGPQWPQWHQMLSKVVG